MTLSGCGLLCQGVHQVVQGTALGVAASVGVGGTASVETSELALVWAAQPYGPAGGASAFDTDSPFDRPPPAAGDISFAVPGETVVPPPALAVPPALAIPPALTVEVIVMPPAAGGLAVGAATRADDPMAVAAAAPSPLRSVVIVPLSTDASALPPDAPAPAASADMPFFSEVQIDVTLVAEPTAAALPGPLAVAGAAAAPQDGAAAVDAPASPFGGALAAAPWLTDPLPRRHAAIALVDFAPEPAPPPFAAPPTRPASAALGEPMTTAPDRAGDDPPSGAPDPDLDVGADTTATDGQAREGDLLSLQALSRGGLALSGGYSSIEGPIASIKLSRTNIGAPGRDITISARYSKVQTLVELGFSDANILGSKLAIAPSFFYSRSTAVGFDKVDSSALFVQTARGLNLYVGRQLDRGLRVAANYRFSDEDFLIRQKNAACSVAIHGTPFCDALGRSRNSVFSLALSLDRRDSAVDPTRGFQLRLTQDVAGPGGTTRYIRLRAGGTFHRRLSGTFDVSLGLEGGYMKGFDGRSIPLFDRFYIGGNSMRGFDLRGLGPKVIPTAAGPNDATAIGGRAYYVGRLEVSMRLDGSFGKFGVSPSIFVDAGSVFGAKKSELGPGEVLIGNSAKPRVAVGFGVSFNVSPGKLRFNVAQPVARQAGDRSKIFSITFGTAF